MRCIICKKGPDETKLFDGIFDDEMINICEFCAKNERIPIIQKPSEEQLGKVNERISVRERMERLSGPRRTTDISQDHFIVQGNIAKLRMPERKQYNDEVLDNYYWNLSIYRKRNKMSTKKIAEKAGVNEEIIRSIERGKIPENFREIFMKLEMSLGIKLLKSGRTKISFVRTKEEEEKILRRVERRMDDEEYFDEDKEEKVEKLSKGEINFSNRKELQDVTLNDLVNMKRQREKREAEKKAKLQRDAMIGEEIDLDEGEL